jgi:hypothetical protein
MASTKIDGKQLQNAPNGITGAQINSGTVTSTNVDATIIRADGTNAMTGNLSLGVTGRITNLANGVASTDAATVSQVSAASAGVIVKAPVNVLATSPITLSGEQTIDGVLTSSSRVLVAGQASAIQNGIYVSGPGAWTRSTDMAAGSSATGAITLVAQGTVHAGEQWVCLTASPAVVGTNAINFTQFSTSSPPARPAIENKNMTALVTTADNQLATATTVANTNINGGDVAVDVNGCGQRVGNGTKVGVDCYISGDGGVTARTFASVTAGDSIYWNGSVAAFQLATTDRIDLFYSESYT